MSRPDCRKGPFSGITMDRVDRFPSTAKFSDIAGIDQVAMPACHWLCIASVTAASDHLLAAALLLAARQPDLLSAAQALA